MHHNSLNMAAATQECGGMERGPPPKHASKKPKISIVHNLSCRLHQAIKTYSTTPYSLNSLLAKGVELCCGDGMNCFFTAVVQYGNKRKICEWNDLIEILLHYDPSGVHARGPNDETLFMLFPEKYEYFLKLGADPHATSKQGNVLLHAVKKKCSSAVIEALLKLNIDVNSAPTHGMNCFFTAAVKYENGSKIYERNDVIDTLLRYEPSGVNSRGPNDETLFMLFPEKYEYFLKLGADPHATSKQGNVLLHAVKKNCPINVIEALLNLNIDVNSFDEEGKTTLMYASSHPNIAMKLLEKGANIHAEDHHGKSVFMRFSETTPLLDETSVKHFIKYEVNVDHQDKEGTTALLAACMKYQFSKLRSLIVHCKANPSMPNKNGTTPLHYAAASAVRSSLQIVNFLIKIGVQLNCQDSKGNTPLILAVTSSCHYNPSNEFIESLLTAGANVNIVNNESKSALMVACQKLDTPCIELLLKLGASTLMKDCDGKTPLLHVTSNLSLTSHHLEIIKLLLEHGSNIFECDNLGLNVFYNVLEKQSSEDVIQYVYQYAAAKLQEKAIVFPENFQDPLSLLWNHDINLQTYGIRQIDSIIFKFSQTMCELILSSPVANPLVSFNNDLIIHYREQLLTNKFNFNFISMYVQNLQRVVRQLRLVKDCMETVGALSQSLNNFQNYGFQITSTDPTVISPLTVLMSSFYAHHEDICQKYLSTAQDFIARGVQTYQRLFCFKDERMRTLSDELQLPDALWAATAADGQLKCVRLLLDYWPGHPLTLLLFVSHDWFRGDLFQGLIQMLLDLGGPLPPGSRYICQVEGAIGRIDPGHYNNSYVRRQEMVNDFRNAHTVVPSLQSLCRYVIRSCIPHGGNDLPERFASLPLPKDLCQYIAQSLGQ